MKKPIPILKFEPLLKSVIWGGRNMGAVLNRDLPTDDPYGESWEVSDLPENQSRVSTGSGYTGCTLEEMLATYPREMLGAALMLEGRFPLLVKFIDAQKTLSVQVHPDSDACKKLKGGARPKTEAWYVIHAAKDAKLYVGVKEGVTRTQFEDALKEGTVASLLHAKPVKRGDYVFLPSGTIHAIGEGIVLAEVQQSSDTTYRVFDWNRLGLDGKPRQLHVNEAMAAIHFESFGEPPVAPPASGRPGVYCKYFSMETVALDNGQNAHFESDGPIIVMVTAGGGELEISAQTNTATSRLGESVFVPASQSSSVMLTASGDVEMVVIMIP